MTSSFHAGLLTAAGWIAKGKGGEGSPVLHRKLLGDQVWIMAAYILVKDIKAKAEDEIK